MSIMRMPSRAWVIFFSYGPRDRPRSCCLAGRQAQARQEKLAVLGVAVRQIGRHDLRGNRAQLSDDRARFVEPPHLRIARGERAVRDGGTRTVLNGSEQLR